MTLNARPIPEMKRFQGGCHSSMSVMVSGRPAGERFAPKKPRGSLFGVPESPRVQCFCWDHCVTGYESR